MKTSDDKLDYVVEQIGGINKTLEFQSKQLETHIKRTEMLENRVVPIEDHVKFIQGLVKLSLYAMSVVGVVVSVLKFLRKI
jgi:hypothetical protein